MPAQLDVEEGALLVTRLDHIDLMVPDLEAAVAFLEAVGLRVVRRTDPERGSIELAVPGEGQVVFELRERPGLARTTLNHIAFRTDDAEADLRRLRSVGVAVTKEQVLIRHSGRTISNVEDPSGASWQLTD